VTGCRVKTLNVFAVASAKAARALIALSLCVACTVAYADTYQYDERGDLQTLTTPRGVRSYQYDEVQRLKIEQGYTGNREHVYDRNGNRATDGATAPGSPTAATYADDSNRIATINGATVSIDAAGQITNDGVNTYTWDDAGRLKTVSRAGQLRATYHYDHKHRRTRKVTTAAAPQGVQTTRYHYDDRDRLMAETTGTGVPLRSYVRADDTLLAIAEHIPQGGGTYEIRMLYLELDHLGTPRQARIDGGAIVWRWESDGYGTSPANEDPDGNGQPTTVNLRFPGQYYDEESGLHYNWHRYYVPRLGRYLSSDPIGLDGGRNTYAYANNAPTTYKDLTGELPSAVAGALAGAAFDIGIQLVGNGMRPKCIKWDVVAIAALTGAVNPFSSLSAANSALKAERQFARAAGLRDGTRAATRTAQRGDRHNSRAWKEAASWVGVEATAEGVGSLIPDERHIRIGDSCECR
jgi:RHS repeat-associated protein